MKRIDVFVAKQKCAALKEQVATLTYQKKKLEDLCRALQNELKSLRTKEEQHTEKTEEKKSEEVKKNEEEKKSEEAKKNEEEKKSEEEESEEEEEEEEEKD